MGQCSIHEDSNQGRKQVKGQGKTRSRGQSRGKDTIVKIEDKAWYKTIVEQVVKTVVKAQDKVKKVEMVNKKRGKMQHCQ